MQWPWPAAVVAVTRLPYLCALVMMVTPGQRHGYCSSERWSICTAKRSAAKGGEAAAVERKEVPEPAIAAMDRWLWHAAVGRGGWAAEAQL